MSALESFLHAPSAAATGWALLHSLWQGGVLAGAFGVLLLLVRSPRVRYVAACAALLLMLAAFCVTLFLMLPKKLDSVRSLGSIGPVALAWPSPSAADPVGSLGAGLSALVPWLSLYWIVGVCSICALRLGGGASIGRLRRRGVCSAPERWLQELVRLQARFGVSRPVALLESCLAETPMVLGHFRPLILMPIGVLSGLPPAQVEAILLHELAHVRRCDYLVNLLQRLVEVLFFYHPAIWWISRQARDEREKCCDDAVVSIGRNSHDYAAALAALEENRALLGGAALAATGGTLVKRIRRLLYPQAPRSAWAPLLAAVLFFATAAVAIAAAKRAVPSRQSPAATQTQAQATVSVIAATQEQQLTEAEKELEQLKAMTSAGAPVQQLIATEKELQRVLTMTSPVAAMMDQLTATQKQLEELKAADVRVPKTKTMKELTQARMVVRITHSQLVYLNGKPVNIHRIGQQVAAKSRNPKTQLVYVRCDEHVPYGTLAEVMDELKQAGIVNINLVTRPLNGQAQWHNRKAEHPAVTSPAIHPSTIGPPVAYVRDVPSGQSAVVSTLIRPRVAGPPRSSVHNMPNGRTAEISVAVAKTRLVYVRDARTGQTANISVVVSSGSRSRE